MAVNSQNDGFHFQKRLFVAVHAGAGFHSQEKAQEHKTLCRKACEQAMLMLYKKKSAADAVTSAVCVLENADLSNAGRGSNLTMSGTIECDACVMDGATSLFGAIGCVSGILNPVRIAHCLLEKQQKSSLTLGRIPPSVLVGEGARQWAKREGFSCDDHHKLMTENSLRLYKKYRRKVEHAENHHIEKKSRYADNEDRVSGSSSSSEHTMGAQTNQETLPCLAADSDRILKMQSSQYLQDELTKPQTDLKEDHKSYAFGTAEFQTVTCRMTGNAWFNQKEILNTELSEKKETVEGCNSVDFASVQDTVGAICIDWEGHISAAVSSGGIWLKHPGRLGPASMYGASCWAQDARGEQPGIGVITSGCGEHVMRTLLAKTCADCLVSATNASVGLETCFKKHFLESHLLPGVESKLAGAVVILATPTEDNLHDIDVCWGHTTESLAVGYMRGNCHFPRTLISRLSEGCRPGQSFAMSGDYFSHQTDP